MYCHTRFDNRNQLFEHLEKSGHALDLTNPRNDDGTEYRRPEESRMRDKGFKWRKLEEERQEHLFRLQKQHEQRQAPQLGAFELARELQRLQKEKEEEEEKKRQRSEEEMRQKKEEALKALQKHQQEVELEKEQEEFMLKQQEKQKRQRELDEAEEAKQRQAKQPKRDTGLVCRTCARGFDTRSQLHRQAHAG